MRQPRCVFSLSTALRRVFLAPAELPPAMATRRQPSYLSPRLFTTTSPSLRVYQPPKPFSAEKKKPKRPIDNAIPYKFVRLVAEDETLGEPQRLSDVLQRLDRQRFIVVMVAPPLPPKEDDPDSDDGPAESDDPFASLVEAPLAPICRIVDKQEQARREAELRRAMRRKEVNRKELELNWAIAPNDLEHRLRRLSEFLGKGMRVEVMLAKKKRGRAATAAEADTLIATLRETATEAGATETKLEGRFPGVTTIVFEGGGKGKK